MIGAIAVRRGATATTARSVANAAVRIVTTATALGVTAGLLCACGGNEPIEQPFASIATTTTRLASANIIGLDRDSTAACAAPITDARAPKSIIVADPALLDGICALGLQQRVTAIGGDAPSYLGAAVSKLPRLQDGAQAELSVGTDESAEANRRAGRTTIVPAPSSDWRRSFLALATAAHLQTQAQRIIAAYEKDAGEQSTKIDAIHNVVSLVRFTSAGTALAEGTAPLAAQVLADLKVNRPQPQRTPQPVTMPDGDYSAAEADLIYIGYQGDKGREFGMSVMTSKPWELLRAVTAKRQLLVEDAAWFSTGGPVAAGIVLHDVTNTIRASS